MSNNNPNNITTGDWAYDEITGGGSWIVDPGLDGRMGGGEWEEATECSRN